MSINKNYIVASAMMASVALPLMNVSNVEAATDIRTVTASSLNFRSGPSTSYKIIGVLSKGQQVQYISSSDKWLKVKYNGVMGYVYGDYVTTDNSTTIKYVSPSVGLNVRSGPGTNYSKLGKLNYKEKVTVLSTTNSWSTINYNGKIAYVSSTYLQSAEPDSNENNNNNANNNTNTVSKDASQVIAYAKTLLGKPYVWGAQGPSSFDCSGFTYYVFKNKADIVLPRTSSLQSQYGTAVSKSNLKAGDLVFFDTNGVNDGVVSHVGLYIGDGQMIHASYSQKKIVIANFNDSYYQKTYVNARRVL